MDPILALLNDSPGTFAVVASLFGLLVGSFLNVVIHRLPIMMQREWRRECASLLERTPAPDDEAPYNLVHPRSACPSCGHRITALENVPVLSYLFLRGRCAGCATRIPVRYPVIELLTAVLSAVVALHFGFGLEAVAAILLTWVLIVLSVIDIDHQLLPDSITLPVLWLGLALSVLGAGIDAQALFPDPATSIIGALAGYLSLWTVYQMFKLLTGKEGMGFGDFKLLALLGAWLGWQKLPLIVLLSAVVGAAVGIVLIATRKHGREVPIPFGPYLAAAGWIAMLWGDRIIGGYMDVAGL